MINLSTCLAYFIFPKQFSGGLAMVFATIGTLVRSIVIVNPYRFFHCSYCFCLVFESVVQKELILQYPVYSFCGGIFVAMILLGHVDGYPVLLKDGEKLVSSNLPNLLQVFP